jgi:hypothetical protein
LNNEKFGISTMERLMKLDEVSIEFIIACKSMKPFDNVLKVYKGHWGEFNDKDCLNALVVILSPIVELTSNMSLSKILSDLLPENRWRSGIVGLPINTPINEVIVRLLMSEMQRLTKDKFFETYCLPKNIPLKDVITQYLLPHMKVLTKNDFLDS